VQDFAGDISHGWTFWWGPAQGQSKDAECYHTHPTFGLARMELIDTLVRARWVLPVEPDARVLEDHSVAIRAGRIVDVLPADEAQLRYQAAETLERSGHVLMPGLVDANARATGVLLRGRAGVARPADAADGPSWPHDRRSADPEYVRDCTLLASAALQRAGVTCFADAQPWPDVAARTASAAHIRASVGLMVAEGAIGWAATADECIDRGMRLRDEYRGDPLVTMHFAPPAPLATTDATLARVRRLADELDLPVILRLHESAREIERSLRSFGRRPLSRLATLGLVSPQLVALRFAHAAQDEIEALALAGASVVHCPTADLAAATGHCPLARLLGHGVRVALGTDGFAAGHDLDVLGESRIAALLSAGVTSSPTAVVPSDLIRIATLEGARVLGLGEVTGSLVAGKWADLCCLDLRAPRSWPVHDVTAALVYSASSAQVTDTWVAGRRVLADARLTQFDEAEVLERAEHWRMQLSANVTSGADADG
jgi:5-methylthioadenosine/S-adenosylhomocysteine deaminase